MVHSLQRWEVVVHEDGPAALEFADVSFDVVTPQSHLCVVGFVGRGTSVDEKRPVTALEEQMIRDRFSGKRQADHLLIELLATGEIARANDC